MKYNVNGNEIEILKELGKGKSGYSYLGKRADGTLLVLKQIHHEPCSYYSFSDKFQSEIDDYNALKELVRMPELIDSSREQEVILKEYIEGENCFELVRNQQMNETILNKMRSIAQRCKEHNLNIDYFPTNFIVCDDELYYVDYECNPYMEQWDFDHWGYKYWIQSQKFNDYCQQLEKNKA